MVDVVHEPNEDEQAEMHLCPPSNFFGFGYTQFWTLSIECKCRMMVEWSQFIIFASSRAHWRGLMCLNDLHQTPKVFLNIECHLHQNDPPLNEKTIFLLCSLWWHCPHTKRKCFCPPPLLSPLYWTKREECVWNVPISPLDTPFCSVHGSPHYLQMTKSLLNYAPTEYTVKISNVSYT